MNNKYIGKWHIPHSDKVVNGTLTIDDEKGIILETDGNIRDIKIINGNIVDIGDIEIIIGLTNDNKHITLQECIEITGSSVHRYTGSTIYVGETFEQLEDIKFNKLSFTTSNLNDWMMNRNFTFNYNFEEKTFTVNYKLPGPIIARLDDTYNLELETLTELPSCNMTQCEAKIREETRVNICSKSEESLEKFLHMVHIFECFMKISTGVNQNIYDMCGFLDDNRVEIFRSHRTYKGEIVSPPCMPFHFDSIKDRWEEIISSWYRMFAENEDIWNLYFSINNSTELYIRHSFLAYAQVIESYHRRTFDKEDRKEIKEGIKRIIQDCPEKHQEFLTENLKFAHEITLNERLNQLCDGCDIIDIILSAQYNITKEDFVKKIKDNRNYYTHYDASMEKKKSDDLMLSHITSKINIMIHYYLLKEIGFEANDRIKILKKSYAAINIKENPQNPAQSAENLTNESEEDIND